MSNDQDLRRGFRRTAGAPRRLLGLCPRVAVVIAVLLVTVSSPVVVGAELTNDEPPEPETALQWAVSDRPTNAVKITAHVQPQPQKPPAMSANRLSMRDGSHVRPASDANLPAFSAPGPSDSDADDQAPRPARRPVRPVSPLLEVAEPLEPIVFQEAASAEPLPEVLSGDAAKLKRLIADVADATIELNVIMRQSKLIRTRRRVSRVAIADPTIIEFVQFSPRELEVIGRQTGTTALTLWFEPEGPRDRGEVLRYLVTVTRDVGVDRKRRLEYAELQQMVNEMFPNSVIQLFPVADKLIVRGQARDAEEASQIMAIIRGETTSNFGNQGNNGGFGPFIAQGRAAEPFPDASDLPSTNVISLLEVPGEQQVMLKVRIAELKRSAVRDMGVDFTVLDNNFFLSSIISGASNIVAVFDNNDVSTFIKAFTSNGSMKILAEPNLVTLSGHTASFIAGGEFAVPTVVGVGGVQAATTQFRGFGTQLTFTPTVIDKDRIRLNVAPEFSEINNGNSVQGIPGLNTRAAVTTVDMREGQWLAIAGLLQDQQNGTHARIPLLGDIPVAGVLFGSKSMTRDETELIVLVSPELVHPMEAKQLPPLLPGTDITEPGDLDLYLNGRIEGRENCDHRSTVWPKYRSQIHGVRGNAFLQRMNFYVDGPHGFAQ